MSSIVPSVIAASVKECPDPATLTFLPPSAATLTAAASSSRSRGATRSAGRQAWSPAQLRHSGGHR